MSWREVVSVKAINTRWRMPIYALADAYIRIGECLYTHWRLPIYALANGNLGLIYTSPNNSSGLEMMNFAPASCNSSNGR